MLGTAWREIGSSVASSVAVGRVLGDRGQQRAGASDRRARRTPPRRGSSASSLSAADQRRGTPNARRPEPPPGQRHADQVEDLQRPRLNDAQPRAVALRPRSAQLDPGRGLIVRAPTRTRAVPARLAVDAVLGRGGLLDPAGADLVAESNRASPPGRRSRRRGRRASREPLRVGDRAPHIGRGGGRSQLAFDQIGHGRPPSRRSIRNPWVARVLRCATRNRLVAP